MGSEDLVADGLKLRRILRSRERLVAEAETTGYPYSRWIFLVTGRQLRKHEKSKGATHQVKIVVDLPEKILKA